MIAGVLLLLAASQLTDAGAPSDAGGALSALDGGAPPTVDIGGLQIPIAADSSTPGHRPVEGAVDDLSPVLLRPARTAGVNYEDFLQDRTADLSSCASWSPDGRAVKGWLSVEWVVAPDGTPSRFKILENDLDSPLVERCMLREMAGWHFTPPPSVELTLRHNFYLSLPARPELTPIDLPEP